MRANHDFNVNELVVLWESQLMTRSQPMSQQSWFPPYIRHYGSSNGSLDPFQLFQQLRFSQYNRRPGTTRRCQASDSQPNTREFGSRNQERRHRQEGDSSENRFPFSQGESATTKETKAERAWQEASREFLAKYATSWQNIRPVRHRTD